MLLDTHVLLWLVTGSPRLGNQATDAVHRASWVYFSAVSVAEMQIKGMLGRLVVPVGLVARLREQGLVPLALQPDHSEGLIDLPDLVRHDPFDRLLLAQAAAEDLAFLTADTRLLALGLGWIKDAAS